MQQQPSPDSSMHPPHATKEHGISTMSPPAHSTASGTRAVKYVPAPMPYTPGSAMQSNPQTPGTVGYSPAPQSPHPTPPPTFGPPPLAQTLDPWQQEWQQGGYLAAGGHSSSSWAAQGPEDSEEDPGFGWQTVRSGPIPLPDQLAYQEPAFDFQPMPQYLTASAPYVQDHRPQQSTIDARAVSVDRPRVVSPARSGRNGSGGGAGYAPSGLDRPTKVLGTRMSPVTELNPTTVAQQWRLNHRASTLIQKYAGAKWREAQRAKWLVDVVGHIDKDYRHYILEQAHRIQHLEQQLLAMQQVHGETAEDAVVQVSEMGETIRQLQAQLRDSDQVVLELRARIAAMEQALDGAEVAASVAASECVDLQQAVHTLAESEARTRKALATRAFVLKDGLRHSQSRARQLAEAQRRHKLEVSALCHVHDEQVSRERNALEHRYLAQTAAVQAVEQATAKLAVEKVRMELEAYKEPWIYLHGKKSPTQNAKAAQVLGLRMTSLNTLYVPP